MKNLSFKSVLLYGLGFFFLFHTFKIFSNFYNIKIFKSFFYNDNIKKTLQEVGNETSESIGIVLSDFVFWTKMLPIIGIILFFLYINFKNKKKWENQFLGFIFFILFNNFSVYFSLPLVKIIFNNPIGFFHPIELSIVLLGFFYLLISILLFRFGMKKSVLNHNFLLNLKCSISLP